MIERRIVADVVAGPYGYNLPEAAQQLLPRAGEESWYALFHDVGLVAWGLREEHDRSGSEARSRTPRPEDGLLKVALRSQVPDARRKEQALHDGPERAKPAKGRDIVGIVAAADQWVQVDDRDVSEGGITGTRSRTSNDKGSHAMSDDEDLTAEPKQLSTQQLCTVEEPRRIVVYERRGIRSVAEKAGESGELARRTCRAVDEKHGRRYRAKRLVDDHAWT